MARSLPHAAPAFPPPPATVFLVGIGGIGMSGLAQLLRHLGHDVHGSDRQVTGAGRDSLIAALRAQGIQVWPQDGSGVRSVRPMAVIASSAVEPDNPDLVAAAQTPRFGRAQALAAALARVRGTQIAVAGSCGKTSTTGWIASALHALGEPVLMVCGGLVTEFETADSPGNFAADPAPRWVVYEADESDGSLVEFGPDYGVVLNIGTDHYERDKLVDLFRRFLGNCRQGAVIHADLLAEFATPPACGGGLATFRGIAPADSSSATVRLSGCESSAAGVSFTFDGTPCRTHQFGAHSVANAAAVFAVLTLLPGLPSRRHWAEAVGAFRGVRQRFEYVGSSGVGGAPVYNDYAHNPEKIHAAIETVRSVTCGPLLVVFQPHGFGPLGFMRTALGEVLRETLRDGDRFVLLPVYYAGGTTSFSPGAEEVAEGYAGAGLPVRYARREEIEAGLRQGASDIAGVLVMGARDPGLPVWARTLTE